MHIVYWAHSYRPDDAAVNRHFGILIESGARLIVNFDPPSKDLNAAKLEQNLRSCDGMVIVLPWRDPAPSPYILFELGIALRARKPVLVFLDDRIPDSFIPPGVLQRRFSHRTYFRQVREHTHALNELKVFMGEGPGPRYQTGLKQRTCGVVGFRSLPKGEADLLLAFVQTRGYRLLELERVDVTNPLRLDSLESLNSLGIVLRCADSFTRRSTYWAGVLDAAAVPVISITRNQNFSFKTDLPREFQPRLVQESNDLTNVVRAEFDLFEQNFLMVQDAETIDRYTRLQVDAGILAGRYESGTRNHFMEVVMGDKYSVSGQAGAVGSHAHAHGMTFNQFGNQLSPKIDLVQLASELQKLQTAMEREAASAEHKLAIGAVAAAAQSANEKNGPKVMEYLKTAGRWALGVAEKIGVEVAKDAIKGALGG